MRPTIRRSPDVPGFVSDLLDDPLSTSLATELNSIVVTFILCHQSTSYTKLSSRLTWPPNLYSIIPVSLQFLFRSLWHSYLNRVTSTCVDPHSILQHYPSTFLNNGRVIKILWIIWGLNLYGFCSNLHSDFRPSLKSQPLYFSLQLSYVVLTINFINYWSYWTLGWLVSSTDEIGVRIDMSRTVVR